MNDSLRNHFLKEDLENAQEAQMNLKIQNGSNDNIGIVVSPKNKEQEPTADHLINPLQTKHEKVHESLQFDQGDSYDRQFSRHFIFIKILGRGAFGKVVMAKERISGIQYAVKIISKNNVSAGGMERLMSESKILSELDHENIVKFSKVQESETKIFIVMELLLGGTLRQLMEEKKKNNEWFTEIEVAQIMHSILAGVAYFHSKSIVHRDLKPENILIGDGRDLKTVKIADFGLSAAFEAKRSISFTQQCGTLIYMAPEFFIQKIYSKPIDIWSCGIIMYQLLDKGNHPFYDPKRHTATTFKQFMKTSPRITFPQHFTELTKILIQNMTLIDPSSRYTANQALTHPWIGQNPAAEVPLTMNEMLSSVNLQTTFLNIKKAVMFLVYLRKQANNFPELSTTYKQKIKRFSQLKNKEKQSYKKIDIYSDQYLNSIIDFDNYNNNNTNLNHSRSGISDDLIDTPTHQELLIPELPVNEIITFPQDESLSSTPLAFSPPPSRYQVKQPPVLSPELKNRRNMIQAYNRSQNSNNFNQKITGDKNLRAASISLYQNSAVHDNLQNFHKKSSSFHKTTTQSSTGQQTPSSIRESTDSFLSRAQKRYVSDQSPTSTPQESQPTFHIKLMRRDELNLQITNREKINLSNLTSIDQQGGSNSPRKQIVQIVPVKPYPNSSSPVKRTYNNNNNNNNNNTKINGIVQYTSPSKDDNNSLNGSSTKNSSQNGSYAKPTNYMHDDFSQRYEDHLRTKSWQTQTVCSQVTNKEQKGVSKDVFQFKSSCEGLLTPLESIDMQNKNSKNISSIGSKNNTTFNSSCKTKQTFSSSRRNSNNSSRQANQEASEIYKIINAQKAQVAALQIPMRSLNLQTYQRVSPPIITPTQKNQISSNFAKITANNEYSEMFPKEQSPNYEQVLQQVQSSSPLFGRQDVIADKIQQIESSSSLTITHKSLSNYRENSIQRDVLPLIITPKKRQSFSVGQKTTPIIKEFKQNDSAEIKKNTNISKNLTDSQYFNGISYKRDSKGIIQPSNMMMITMTATAASASQNTALNSKYNIPNNVHGSQKKIIDNFQPNNAVIQPKLKKYY